MFVKGKLALRKFRAALWVLAFICAYSAVAEFPEVQRHSAHPAAPQACLNGLDPAIQAHLAAIKPMVTRSEGLAEIEWSGIRNRIRNKSISMNEPASRHQELMVTIVVNGVAKVENLPWDTTHYTF